jgi:hypothetical protein
VIERQLAHAEQNGVRSAYNHADYMDERRKMVQDWSDELDRLESRGPLDSGAAEVNPAAPPLHSRQGQIPSLNPAPEDRRNYGPPACGPGRATGTGQLAAPAGVETDQLEPQALPPDATPSNDALAAIRALLDEAKP